MTEKYHGPLSFDEILNLPWEKLTPEMIELIKATPTRAERPGDADMRIKGPIMIEKGLENRTVSDQIEHIEFHLRVLKVPYKSIIRRGFDPNAAYNSDHTVGEKLQELSELKKVPDKSILYREFRNFMP